MRAVQIGKRGRVCPVFNKLRPHVNEFVQMSESADRLLSALTERTAKVCKRNLIPIESDFGLLARC